MSRSEWLAGPRRHVYPALFFIALALYIFIAIFVAPELDAQVRPLALDEMASSSGRIFIGTVTAVHGGLDQRGDIVTFTTFRVEQAISGVSDATMTIKQIGGSANGIETYLAHMRYFRQGEHLMVM